MWMAHGKLRHDWDETSTIIAVIANLFRGKRQQPVRAAELNPYRTSEPVELSAKESMQHLKSMLLRAGVISDEC